MCYAKPGPRCSDGTGRIKDLADELYELNGIADTHSGNYKVNKKTGK